MFTLHCNSIALLRVSTVESLHWTSECIEILPRSNNWLQFCYCCFTGCSKTLSSGNSTWKREGMVWILGNYLILFFFFLQQYLHVFFITWSQNPRSWCGIFFLQEGGFKAQSWKSKCFSQMCQNFVGKFISDFIHHSHWYLFVVEEIVRYFYPNRGQFSGSMRT